MRVAHHVFSTLLGLWKRKLVKTGLLFFLIFEIVVIFKFDQSPSLVFKRNETTYTRRNSTDFDTMALNKATSIALKTSGKLNLHLWSDTCAADMNILCNFPMFPKAPDKRLLLNTTIISDNITNADGLRLFGFVIPNQSGLYLFTVKFCRTGEVWLSHNDNWRNARKIWDAGRERKDSQASGEIDLVAGRKYFIEFVATNFFKRKKIQLLWKTPTSSSFEIINGTFLSYYMEDSGLTNSNIYDELLPESLVCASRMNNINNTYFQAQREISYLSHDELKDILPYCEYNPSYTVNHKVQKYYAVNKLVVHSFIYPFPEHINLRDVKHWIYPLGEREALQVVHFFMESLDRKMPG